MTGQEIKKLLDHGDMIKIARLAGCESEQWGGQYVSKILSKEKAPTRGKGKKILEIAESIAIRNQQEGKQAQ